MNQEETLAAREKQKRIKERFSVLGVLRPGANRAIGPGL